MPAHSQRERGRALPEAGVAASDGAGRNEFPALEAAVALDMGSAQRVAPVDHDPVLQPRPVRQLELLRQGPVQRQLAVKAHRAGCAIVALADVDHDIAAVGSKRSVARRVVVVRRPA